ncbi:MAG: arginase family protein, partial [Acidobacteria bacterium]|nr:arginase family protein [Acidobacteriota bacterium]
MPRFALLDAPSILGLKPTGVEQLPEALKAAGLQKGLNAEYAGLVPPPPFNLQRDPETRLLNPDGLRAYAGQLVEAVTGVFRQGKFPVVLGGDCSNLIGCALALRRSGRFGLVFLDGHADFYQPEAEPNGEV